MESTPAAVRWPLVDKDPRENGAEAGRWPMWRGHNGAGIAPAGRPAVRFSRHEGLRWTVPLDGEGNSSPVVWDDSIFLTRADTRLWLVSLGRADGQERWRFDAGEATGRTHTKNGHASATVATDGQRVYAFFGSAGLVCCDFEGNLVWRADLGRLDHMWGTASSPLLYGELVIQLADANDGSSIVALNKSTGEVVWRTARDSKGCWTTPIVIEAGASGLKSDALVVNGSCPSEASAGTITAYDPATGAAQWWLSGTTQLVTPTAVAAGGLLFSMSGRNGPIIAIRPNGRGDVTASHMVWKSRRGGPYIPTGLAYRNRLFVMGDAGDLACYNGGDGSLVWKQRLRGQFTASLVAADGRLYAASEAGTVYVVAAEDSFRLLAENEFKERTLATPAIAHGELYLRTAAGLYCVAPLADGAAGAR